MFLDQNKIKIILSLFWLCFSCLLFNNPIIAEEMLDAEKITFIESLAEPLKERKVFYRWQSETARHNLLEAGEMTPQLHTYFMKHTEGTAQGAGFYVAEDLSSSSRFGETLIQVEIEPGYKFLDLTDPNIQKQLQMTGITNKDIYHRLNPGVAIRINRETSWWVLKKQEGIKFKPFSSREMSLDALEKYSSLKGEQKELVKDSIKENILSRAAKDADVFRSPVVEIVEEARGREHVEDMVNRYSRHSKTLEESIKWFKHAGQYLSEPNKKRILDNTPLNFIGEGISLFKTAEKTFPAADRGEIEHKLIKRMAHLPFRTEEEAREALDFASRHFPGPEMKQVVENIASKAKTENSDFFRHVNQYLSKKNKDPTQSIQSIQEGEDILKNVGPYLSKQKKKKLVTQITDFPINGIDELEILWDIDSHFSKQDMEKIAAKIPFDSIDKVSDGKTILITVGKYLSEQDMVKMVERLPFDSMDEAVDFFSSARINFLNNPKSKDNLEKAIASLPLKIKKSDTLLYAATMGFSETNLAKMVEQLPINSIEEGTRLFDRIERGLPPKARDKLSNRIKRLKARLGCLEKQLATL